MPIQGLKEKKYPVVGFFYHVGVGLGAKGALNENPEMGVESHYHQPICHNFGMVVVIKIFNNINLYIVSTYVQSATPGKWNRQ